MMVMVKRALVAAVVFAVIAGGRVLGQGQGGFVPMGSLPPAEQIPAAPLLIAAYVFVWLALMGYLWSIWSRLGRVERDLRALGQRRHSREAR
ncbi:MAG: hypothetical protein IT176_06070 [Acidobacteria bacterium]|nr:hypothetical protein [Acidobacteriota bacterium]